MSMERAYWIDWSVPNDVPEQAQRVYFGHETCQALIPTPAQSRELVSVLRDRAVSASLVTPFLTNDGLASVARLIDNLAGLGELEVICSDWGLLRHLSVTGAAKPVIGRALAAQATDPRIARMLSPSTTQEPARRVRHIDGSACILKHRPPPESLAQHLRATWLNKPSVTGFLTGLGVSRCEVSNTAQGLLLQPVPGLSYSLHVSDVLVAIMQRCPGQGEDFNASPACPRPGCLTDQIEWGLSGLPMQVFRRGNALYYRCRGLPANLADLPIDRLVYRCRS